MRIDLAVLRDAARRPSIQDAGLAALLLAGTWATGDGAAATRVIDGPFAGVAWLREPMARWLLIVVVIAAVAVRRRWPTPALAAASVATVMQMALAAGPVPADVAVPIILYTVAVQRRRAVSLAVLGAVLAGATAWSAYVSLDSRTDGWLHEGRPFSVGGEEGPPPRAALDGPGRGGRAFTTYGPTAWGGIPVLGSLLVVAWAIGWGTRSRRAYLGELRARARDLERERDQQAALAVAAERARLTRELHDVVAHGLAVIVMQAQGGTAAFAKRPADTLAALDTIVATGRASLADIRHVLSASAPDSNPARPTPGLTQLPHLIDRVRQTGTPVELHINGPPQPLPTGVDVSAYRIVQEALTNTMKHAGPGAHARIVLSYRSDELTIDATDDGAAVPVSSGAGNGLRGMRERAALLGGELAAGPGPEGGYAVRARIPLDPGETA